MLIKHLRVLRVGVWMAHICRSIKVKQQKQKEAVAAAAAAAAAKAAAAAAGDGDDSDAEAEEYERRPRAAEQERKGPSTQVRCSGGSAFVQESQDTEPDQTRSLICKERVCTPAFALRTLFWGAGRAAALVTVMFYS